MVALHAGEAAEGQSALRDFSRLWWVFLLRGTSSVLLGLLALTLPTVTLAILIQSFGLYALADGALALAASFGAPRVSRWWFVALGIAGIAAGGVILVHPDFVASALFVVIAAWALASGVVQVIGAIRLRQEIDYGWSFVCAGVLAIGFGALLLTQPEVIGLALIFAVAGAAIGYGGLLIAFSLRLNEYVHAGALLAEQRAQITPPSDV
jgi:uncharacterized membrane protein HdeD (DUF308 family)